MVIENEGGVQAQAQAQEISTIKESGPVVNHVYSFYGSAEDQMREIMKSYYGIGFWDEQRKLKEMNREPLPI